MLPVMLPWNDFEFLDAGIVFSQQGSSKMLFSQLPLQNEEGSGVFLFGSHNGEGEPQARKDSSMLPKAWPEAMNIFSC